MTANIPRSSEHDSALESQRMWLWLIVAAGAGLRLYRLDFQSLWLDEGLQFYVATENSIGELFRQTNSFHPPLSFVINHLFLLVGESDFFLRLPSALFGIASLPLLYVLGRDLMSKNVAVFAVLVLALSPFHIWYSQEGRMYSQLLFLSLLSSWLLIQAVRRGQARWWVYFTVAGAAGMYTHIFMGLALAAHFLWVVLYHRRQMVPIVASGIAIFILFLPWVLLLPWVSHFARSVGEAGLIVETAAGGRARFTWAVAAYAFYVYAAGFSLGPSVAELHEDKSIEFILTFLPSIALVAAVIPPLLGLGIFAIYKRFGARAAAFCLLGLFVPLAGTALYSLTPRAGFNVRYTVMAYPFFCLLAGAALAYLARANKMVAGAALVAVTAISAASLYNHFANPRYAKEDIRSAVAFWRQAGNGEPLLAVGSIPPTQRYVGAAEAERLFWVGNTTRDIIPRMEQVLLAQDLASAYVVLARDWDGAAETAIRDVFGGTLERSFPGAKVFRISRPAGCRIAKSVEGLCGTP
jgi:uncharacterized membrane protein